MSTWAQSAIAAGGDGIRRRQRNPVADADDDGDDDLKQGRAFGDVEDTTEINAEIQKGVDAHRDAKRDFLAKRFGYFSDDGIENQRDDD